MKIYSKMITRFLLLTIIVLFGSFLISSESHAQLEYSHLFEQDVNYFEGSPQYDDWLTFRASLPSSGVASITMSGSRNPEGRTCDNPAIAQQIADAMRAGADGLPPGEITLSVNCNGFIWNTGSCPDSPPENNLEINVGPIEAMCSCQLPNPNPNWTIRPIVSEGDWGAIDGSLGEGPCNGTTQTMTIRVEIVSNSVPTLSEWGLIVMAGILGIVGFIVIRRKNIIA